MVHVSNLQVTTNELGNKPDSASKSELIDIVITMIPVDAHRVYRHCSLFLRCHKHINSDEAGDATRKETLLQEDHETAGQYTSEYVITPNHQPPP